MTYPAPDSVGTRNRLTAVALLFGLIISSISCESSPLSNSFSSAEALAEAVLDALDQEDRDAMLALMVTREEHLDVLWEQLPERNHLSFDYVRLLNERNSNKGIREAISRFGGTKFELLSIEFTKPSEVYEGYTLHLGTVLTVRRVSDGLEGELPILDVVLEYGGRWKLMNYEE
jgi:hypothetical protein